MKSWKTTLAGLVAGLAILFGEANKALDDDPNTNPSVELILVGLGAMGIGFSARDNDVTSEQAGVKK